MSARSAQWPSPRVTAARAPWKRPRRASTSADPGNPSGSSRTCASTVVLPPLAYTQVTSSNTVRRGIKPGPPSAGVGAAIVPGGALRLVEARGHRGQRLLGHDRLAHHQRGDLRRPCSNGRPRGPRLDALQGQRRLTLHLHPVQRDRRQAATHPPRCGPIHPHAERRRQLLGHTAAEVGAVHPLLQRHGHCREQQHQHQQRHRQPLPESLHGVIVAAWRRKVAQPIAWPVLTSRRKIP